MNEDPERNRAITRITEYAQHRSEPCRCDVCALIRLGFTIVAPDGTVLGD